MKRITLEFSDHTKNVVQYIADKYHTSIAEIITEAINEYYSDDIEELVREEKMSEYGCCTLSKCVYTGNPIPESCDECPHYDPNFFKEENNADTSDHGER